MRALMMIFFFAGMALKGYGQLNIGLLHQLVAESKSENDRQNEARNRQSVTTANEEVNRSQMTRLKAKYRELQSRFKAVGLAIDAAQIGIEAIPVVNELIRQQSVIYQLAADNPLLIVLAYQAEEDLAKRAGLLINFIYGIALSIGDINQMKASDRKMLFAHVLNELKRIEGASKGLAVSMRYASRPRSLNPFADFVNQDKRLVNEILRNAAILKN
jgi:hypothetical protein